MASERPINRGSVNFHGAKRRPKAAKTAYRLRRGGANLLPGRVVLEYLDPLMVAELPRPFDLQRALQVGMLPGIFLGGGEALDLLGTYAEVYLREEIRAEALTKNIGGYARFLDVSAIVSGQWLNYSKIATDTEIPKETIRRFVEILEDTLLLFRIPPFRARRRISRRVSQRDRVLLFDVGVRNALLSLHRRPVSPDQVGGVFEQWYMLQALYLNRALRKEWTLARRRVRLQWLPRAVGFFPSFIEVPEIPKLGSDKLDLKRMREIALARTSGERWTERDHAHP